MKGERAVSYTHLTGEYQGKYSVIDMLNQYILETDQVSLTEWTALSNGIPVPRSSQKQIAKILNGSTDDNRSDDTPVISPTAVPSATPIISPTTVPNGDKTDNTKDDTSSDQSGIGSNTSNGNTALEMCIRDRRTHSTAKSVSLFLQRKWRRPLRFPNSNVHQTGLAPISDESAHNKSKKAKNLRYP